MTCVVACREWCMCYMNVLLHVGTVGRGEFVTLAFVACMDGVTGVFACREVCDSVWGLGAEWCECVGM